MTATKKKTAAAKIALSTGARHNYTEIERRLFSLLSERERTTSSILATRLFGEGDLFGRNNAVSRMRMLAEKVRRNEEPFRIVSGGARGPKPIEYWVERS